MEVEKVLVFAYLDPVIGAFRVSVHLDGMDPVGSWLVRPDGTVPLRVEIEDTVVFDSAEQPSG